MPSILITDNDVAYCMQLEEQLRTWGHEIAIAHSGEAAARFALRTKPDLILLGIVMSGGMNGMDAAKIIQSRIDSPIVFITGCEDRIWVEKASQFFPAGFLYKPVSVAQLYAVINIALRNQSVLASRPHRIYPPPPLHTHQSNSLKLKENGDYEKSTLLNFQSLVCPFMLREISVESAGDILGHENIHVLESCLKEIISPLIRKLSCAGIRLSPAEIKVAVLVRQGKSSKQIADLLRLSVETINSHRKSIRKKLGITSSRSSLGTYLSAL